MKFKKGNILICKQDLKNHFDDFNGFYDIFYKNNKYEIDLCVTIPGLHKKSFRFKNTHGYLDNKQIDKYFIDIKKMRKLKLKQLMKNEFKHR